MPYCVKCEKDNLEGTFFCPNCGIYISQITIKEKNMPYMQRARKSNLYSIYAWIKDLGENVDAYQNKILSKAVFEIGCSRKKAQEYLKIAMRMKKDEKAKLDFEKQLEFTLEELKN